MSLVHWSHLSSSSFKISVEVLGMELTLAVQTAADIDRINPDLTRQVIENAGNLLSLSSVFKTVLRYFQMP